ncbi:MAG: hypothetical protein HY884_00880 [Deltaproteobacteria bacterium]|nr:hypothetical protein [Deltaproteobacteria bacterium]
MRAIVEGGNYPLQGKPLRFNAAFLFFFLGAATLSGCAAGVTLTPVTPVKADGFSPFESGVVKTKNVGEVMVMYNLLVNVDAYPGFVATEDFKLPAPTGQTYPVIEKDSEWKVFAKTEDGSFVAKNINKRMSPVYTNPVRGQTMEMPREVCLLVNGMGEPYGVVTYRRCSKKPDALYGTEEYLKCALSLREHREDQMSEKRAIFAMSPQAERWENKPKNFLKPTTIFHGTKSGKIIYLGKTREAIRVLYQETGVDTRDLELTFDLTESKVIAVKDVIIEILEATNTSISYIVKTKADDLKARLMERERNPIGNNTPAPHEI